MKGVTQRRLTQRNLKWRKRGKNRFRPAIRPDGHADESQRGKRASERGRCTTDLTTLYRQAVEGFLVFLGSFFDDLRRETGRGRGFMPVERLKVIANELFVVAEGAGAGLVRVGRPEP